MRGQTEPTPVIALVRKQYGDTSVCPRIIRTVGMVQCKEGPLADQYHDPAKSAISVGLMTGWG